LHLHKNWSQEFLADQAANYSKTFIISAKFCGNAPEEIRKSEGKIPILPDNPTAQNRNSPNGYLCLPDVQDKRNSLLDI